MIEVEEAVRLLEAAVAVQTETELVGILNAVGRVAARDVVSPLAVPRFARSAMDGYAVHAADTASASKDAPLRAAVLGEVFAGDDKTFDARPGTAVRIMTGGPLPPGYDAVVKQEDTDCGMQAVEIWQTVAAGANVGEAGEDLRPGQRVIQKYEKLAASHVGVLASMGMAVVEVLKPLRVGVVATGDELAAPGDTLGPAQIYNSSSYTIAAQAKAAGAQLCFLDICPDDPARFCELVKTRAPETDVILTTGGVSVGKRDFVPTALETLGAEPVFRRVNMKPGTPVLAAKYGDAVIVCLSGNPFAALVNFNLFFWPMLAKRMANPDFTWRRRRAVLREGSLRASVLRRFVRAHKREDGVHLYTENHRSSVFSNIPASNCIIDQPAGQALAPGDEVDVLYWKF